MARFSDEIQDYYDDCRDKKITAKSARNRRGRNSKSGAVKFSTDYLTEKQLRAMDGECKTYRLGAPMDWEEFSAMPDDLKVMYIKKLRKQYNVPDNYLAMAMGVDISDFNKQLAKLKLGVRTDSWTEEEHDRFAAWWVIVKEV